MGRQTSDTKQKANLVQLSKFLSLLLRHRPERFGLRLDEEGWASLAEVMDILHRLPNLRWATRADVMHIVEREHSRRKELLESLAILRRNYESLK